MNRLAVLISVVVVVAVGLWSYRQTRHLRDYYIGDQRFGLGAVALATMAAAFSGFVFLGGPGLTYTMGVASFAIILPVGFTAGLLCWTVAVPLHRLAETRDVLTIPDAVDRRFESRLTTGLATLAVLIGTVAYLGVQLLALAILLETLFETRELLGDWSLPLAMVAGLLVIVPYSVLGGMVAGVYTDVIQGLVMLVAAIAVAWRAVWVGRGPMVLVANIAEDDRFRGFFDPLGNDVALATLSFFLVFGVGVLGQPHMLHKFYMLRDARQLRWMPFVLGGSQAVCLLVWVGIGLAVPAMVASGEMLPLGHPDEAAPRFLLELCPPWLSGLVVAAALAAIMSTADSFLNIGAGALVRDLPRLLGREAGHRLRSARLATVGIAGFAALLAVGFGDLVGLLGTLAFGTLGAALAPVLVLGLSWTRVTSSAASASIVVGLGTILLLEGARRLFPESYLAGIGSTGGAVPAAIAMMAAFTVALAMSFMTGRENRDRIAPEVLAAMENS